MIGRSRTKRPQARSRAATRRRLLSAGARLFARRGFSGTNSNEIARAAGVATGTFYLHFEDKVALLRAIALQVHEAHQQQIRAQLAAEEGLADSLRVRAAALLDLAEANRPLVRVVLGPAGHEAGVADELLGAIAGYMRTDITARIRRGDADPGLDVGVAAECLAAMWARCAFRWAEDPRPASREAVLSTLVQLTQSGLASRSGADEPKGAT